MPSSNPEHQSTFASITLFAPGKRKMLQIDVYLMREPSEVLAIRAQQDAIFGR
jgi:hypothetical protein